MCNCQDLASAAMIREHVSATHREIFHGLNWEKNVHSMQNLFYVLRKFQKLVFGLQTTQFSRQFSDFASSFAKSKNSPRHDTDMSPMSILSRLNMVKIENFSNRVLTAIESLHDTFVRPLVFCVRMTKSGRSWWGLVTATNTWQAGGVLHTFANPSPTLAKLTLSWWTFGQGSISVWFYWQFSNMSVCHTPPQWVHGSVLPGTCWLFQF